MALGQPPVSPAWDAGRPLVAGREPVAAGAQLAGAREQAANDGRTCVETKSEKIADQRILSKRWGSWVKTPLHRFVARGWAV